MGAPRDSDLDWEALRGGAVPTVLILNATNASELLQEQLLAQFDAEPATDIRESFRGSKPGYGPRVRLERPPGKRLGDDFYRQVAAAYLDAVSRGLKPRKALQKDTDAAQDTVAGWIKRAREKGYLPRAAPGKVGGRG